ncbi:hypothetical protein [Paraburkholderia phosphatilytica]|uniref:hypothetical protein n=1 Tax=Paraburkholderia phosphatilytica TaxID=2282883 RepID=UPI000F5FF744|nr:hypothetical protein [Paraburkholderia phosphatilytica]
MSILEMSILLDALDRDATSLDVAVKAVRDPGGIINAKTLRYLGGSDARKLLDELDHLSALRLRWSLPLSHRCLRFGASTIRGCNRIFFGGVRVMDSNAEVFGFDRQNQFAMD